MRTLLLLALWVGALIPMAAEAADPLPFERGSWARLRAEHAGHSTVFHFWGLTCGPCLVEMPQWGKLLTERRDLRLVLVAADPVPQSPQQIDARLAHDGLARVESWSFADRFTERLFYEIDPAWSGELPHTLMMARDGNVTAVAGTADFAKVRAWLDAQAAAPAKTERQN